MASPGVLLAFAVAIIALALWAGWVVQTKRGGGRVKALPIVTLAGIQLGAMFSGAVIIETIFAWPGVGQLAIQGVYSRDYTLVQGVVVVNTVIFILLLFIVDLSYGLLDPRVRTHTRGATAG